MLRRLPAILGSLTALAALLVLGPIGLAVALLRSSPEAQGATLAAQLFIAALVLAVAALAGVAVWGLSHLVVRLFRRGG